MRRSLAALALAAALPASLHASCLAAARGASIHEIVARVQAEGVRLVFIGERHGVGPIKRFAVDLANALVDGGHDVGLYVEGFRTDCAPRDETCPSLARQFNRQAFRTLLDESRASVHAIDPPQADRRVARMATAISAGSEAVRVVLVGNSHVLYADDLEAEHWVFGGGLRYPDPGDLVKAFSQREHLTVALEIAEAAAAPYSIHEVQGQGCGTDYVVATPLTAQYWTTLADSAPGDDLEGDEVAATGALSP